MYAGKNICVTGTLKEYEEYHGRPEIIVSTPDQITIQ
jgi:DNA/RNA endonuclease YhcR with UshA esterase domain